MSKDLHPQALLFVMMHHLPSPQPMLICIALHPHNLAATTTNRTTMAIGRVRAEVVVEAKAEEAIEVVKDREWPRIVLS